MGRFNGLLIVVIGTIALLALTGTASATPTITVNTLQANGHYIGIPKIINAETYTYGYDYTFTPDGTYTVFCTATNDQNTEVLMGAAPEVSTKFNYVNEQDFIVPANSKQDFSITFAAPSRDAILDVAYAYILKEGYFGVYQIDISKVDFENAPDLQSHTIDEGPMSDAIATYTSDGKITYKGAPQYQIS